MLLAGLGVGLGVVGTGCGVNVPLVAVAVVVPLGVGVAVPVDVGVWVVVGLDVGLDVGLGVGVALLVGVAEAVGVKVGVSGGGGGGAWAARLTAGRNRKQTASNAQHALTVQVVNGISLVFVMALVSPGLVPDLSSLPPLYQKTAGLATLCRPPCESQPVLRHTMGR